MVRIDKLRVRSSSVALLVTVMILFLSLPEIIRFYKEYVTKVQKHRAFRTEFKRKADEHFRKIKPSKIPENGIYFLETSGLPMLSPKQLCAVESAALHHSNRPVVVAVNNEFLQLPFFVDIWSEIYPNIAFTRLEIQNWLNGTVLESWLSKHLLDSSGYKTIHTSDVLRYATLFKYGGLYLDTDVIVIKSMTDLVNALGIESNDLINGAVMAFVKHHPVMKCCLMDILSKYNSYNSKGWAESGPLLISRVIRQYCGWNDSSDFIPGACKDVKILNTSAFYPVHYTEWPRLIHSDVDISAKALKETEESYLVHYWGRLSVDEAIQLNTPQALALLARKHCPKVSAAMTDGKLWGFNVLPVGQF